MEKRRRTKRKNRDEHAQGAWHLVADFGLPQEPEAASRQISAEKPLAGQEFFVIEANADMVEGYMDGYDLNAPEPTANRSHSYRHSFWIGRAEKLKLPLPRFQELERRAELAVIADNAA